MNLENTVISIFNAINVKIVNSDIDAYHRFGKKNVNFRFTNGKHLILNTCFT